MGAIPTRRSATAPSSASRSRRTTSARCRQLRHLAPERYQLSQHRTAYTANGAHTAYLRMNSPKDLDARHLSELQALTTDTPEVKREPRVGASGSASVMIALRSHDVVLLSLRKAA